MEVKYTFTTSGGTLTTNSKAYVHLTPTQVFGGTNVGNPVPPFPTPIQTIFQPTYSTLLLNVLHSEYINFNTNFTAGNVWFYPFSDNQTVVTQRITGVTICLKDPCKQLQVAFKYQQKCQSFNFFPIVSGLSGIIIGYVWDFGDGTFSNLPNPNHYYATPGVYVVTLLVYTKTPDGKCCKQVFKRKI